MKLNIIVIMIAAVLIAATLSAFGVYDFLNANTEESAHSPGTDITINTSELYRTDKFSWYVYTKTENHEAIGEPYYNKTLKSEFGDGIFNGTLSKRWRDTITCFNSSGTNITQCNDNYWDASGLNYIATQIQVFTNNTLILSNTEIFSNMGQYQKRIFLLPYGCYIAYNGTEKVTIDNMTYDCQKYYLGTVTHDHISSVYNLTYWFNDSIPVPVKICHDGMATYELAGWG